MSVCAVSCPLEATQQDSASLGAVGDEETIIRGAYDPSHGKAATLNISNGIVNNKDLIAGIMSVYRSGSPKGIGLTDAVTILKDARSDAHLFAISGAAASEIRAIRRKDGSRAFCVLDECDCDQNGGKHFAHAHISLCRKYKDSGFDEADPDYAQIRRQLINLFRPKARIVWHEQIAA